MSHRKQRETPSYVTGEKGKNRVRVFTDPRTGKVYLEYRDHQGRKARTACGHRDFASAKAQADELAAQSYQRADSASMQQALAARHRLEA